MWPSRYEATILPCFERGLRSKVLLDSKVQSTTLKYSCVLCAGRHVRASSHETTVYRSHKRFFKGAFRHDPEWGHQLHNVVYTRAQPLMLIATKQKHLIGRRRKGGYGLEETVAMRYVARGAALPPNLTMDLAVIYPLGERRYLTFISA